MVSEKCPNGFTLRHTMKANNRAITRVAWSPNGRLLASASYDQTVRIWDTETGKQEKELYGYSGSVFTVCITPDGRYAVSASKSALKVWDMSGSNALAYIAWSQMITFMQWRLHQTAVMPSPAHTTQLCACGILKVKKSILF